MAAQLPLRQMAGINLGAVGAALAELPQRQEQMADYEDWAVDWTDVMARFEWLVDLAERGRLAPTEQVEYERLLDQLRQSLALAVQLDLPVPGRVQEAMLRLAVKREIA